LANIDGFSDLNIGHVKRNEYQWGSVMYGFIWREKKLTLLHSTCQSEKSLNQLYYESSERLLK
jgi:hypothetical protein